VGPTFSNYGSVGPSHALDCHTRMTASILVIEDEKQIADWIQRYLEAEDYPTMVAHSGELGIEMMSNQHFDLIILDIMLPGMDGFEVAKSVRLKSSIPIIMLTARDTFGDRVKGLDIGADDYVLKPFDPGELIARVNAVLRRVGANKDGILKTGPFELDERVQTVSLHGEQIDLTFQQFSILAMFIRNPNQLITRQRLIDGAFEDFEGYDRAIDTHISRIRGFIEADPRNPKYLKTEYGAGYRFSPE